MSDAKPWPDPHADALLAISVDTEVARLRAELEKSRRDYMEERRHTRAMIRDVVDLRNEVGMLREQIANLVLAAGSAIGHPTKRT